MHRSESPETLYTMTTQQTKPPGANVIETRYRTPALEDFEMEMDLNFMLLLSARSSDLELSCESEEEDADEMLITNSPEPPEPIVLEEAIQMDEHGQPGRLHPEQDLPHVFKVGVTFKSLNIGGKVLLSQHLDVDLYIFLSFCRIYNKP